MALGVSCRSAGPVIEVPAEMESSKTGEGLVRRGRPAMGTLVQVTIDGPVAEVNEAAEVVYKEFGRVESKMSAWMAGSELSLIGASAGRDWVVVSSELFGVLERALEVSRLSGGAFDPTFAAFWGLWTFGDDGVHRVPKAEVISSRLALVDYTKVHLDSARRAVKLKRKGMKLGLGAIAKGYATDRAVAEVDALGRGRFLIQAGGEMFGRGRWSVGIKHPRGRGVICRLAIEDEALATSGDYERFFEVGGVRYHHILDPKTGRPARGVMSASVVAGDSVTADAWSTALFVMGGRGMAVIEEMKGIEAVLVDATGRVVVSSGLKGRVECLGD